jgi:flagellar biosynthesis component FlhA
MTDQELKDLVASLAIESKKTDKQLSELSSNIDKTNKELRDTLNKLSLEVDKTNKSLQHMKQIVGGVTNNQGDITEEYFVNSLKDKLKVGDIDFDFLVQNFKAKKDRKILAEYDILLVNGESVAIVEVKYKVHLRDLEKLPDKIKSIRNLPQYDGYEVYAGLAGFFVPDEVIEEAQEKGYFILQRKGDVVVTHIENLKSA